MSLLWWRRGFPVDKYLIDTTEEEEDPTASAECPERKADSHTMATLMFRGEQEKSLGQ